MSNTKARGKQQSCRQWSFCWASCSAESLTTSGVSVCGECAVNRRTPAPAMTLAGELTEELQLTAGPAEAVAPIIHDTQDKWRELYTSAGGPPLPISASRATIRCAPSSRRNKSRNSTLSCGGWTSSARRKQDPRFPPGRVKLPDAIFPIHPLVHSQHERTFRTSRTKPPNSATTGTSS